MKTKKIMIFSFLILSFILFVFGVVFCFTLPFNVDLEKHTSLPFIAPLMSFVLAAFAFLCCLYSFFAYTCHFPLNDVKEYLINVHQGGFGKIVENELIIKVKEVAKGKYQIDYDGKILSFDLSGYLFPRAYLKAYFIRNYNYRQINSDKAKLHNVLGSVKLTYLKKYSNVSLLFGNKTITVVKNNKTTATLLSVLINYSPFWHILLRRAWKSELSELFYSGKLDEKIYKQKCIKLQ